MRFRATPAPPALPFYFLAGMMPWLAFSDAVARAPGILIEHRNFIRKLVFPVETLPVNIVVTGLVTEFFGIAILLLGLLIVHGHIPATVALPAAADDPADPADGRFLLVSRGHGRLRSRPGPDQRLSADHLVFRHPDLLPRTTQLAALSPKSPG